MPHPRSPARLAGRASYSAFSNRYSIPTMNAEISQNATPFNDSDSGTDAKSSQDIRDKTKSNDKEKLDATVGTSGFPKADDTAFSCSTNIVGSAERDTSGNSITSGEMRELLKATEGRLKASDDRLAVALMTVDKLEAHCKALTSTSKEQSSRIERLEGALYEHIEATEARLAGALISSDSKSVNAAEADAARGQHPFSSSPSHYGPPHETFSSSREGGAVPQTERGGAGGKNNEGKGDGKTGQHPPSSSLAAFVACLDDTMDRKMGCVVDALSQRAEQAHALASAQHDATAARVVNLLHRMDGLDRRFDAMPKPREASTCIADLDRRLARIETWQQRATTTSTREQKQSLAQNVNRHHHVSFAPPETSSSLSDDNHNHENDHSSSSSSSSGISRSSSHMNRISTSNSGNGRNSTSQEHLDSGRECSQNNSSDGNASTATPAYVSPDLDIAAEELMTDAASCATAVELQAAAAAASNSGVTPSAAVLAALAAAENVTGSATALSKHSSASFEGSRDKTSDLNKSSISSGAATTQTELISNEGDKDTNLAMTEDANEEVGEEQKVSPQCSPEREERADKTSFSGNTLPGNVSEERPRQRNAHNDRPATNSAGRVTDPKSPGARLLMRRVTRSPKFV